ncbi:hypothetical protein [Pseudonocardia sp. ICBG601]|uniref:hypothetical protein n=1 Tax=Pseudonocardia sp. ICBG601 TaxID=2846759 RepID=UPI001CF67619|nr:hypothetical protein [Pseudonocardia sp. ICBG601]
MTTTQEQTPPPAFRVGRPAQEPLIGNWVFLAGVTDLAYEIYCLLSIYIDYIDDDGDADDKTVDTLVDMFAEPADHATDAALAELAELGALTHNADKTVSVHHAPPPDYRGPLDPAFGSGDFKGRFIRPDGQHQ